MYIRTSVAKQIKGGKHTWKADTMSKELPWKWPGCIENNVRKLIVYEQFKELNIFNRLLCHWLRIQNTDGASHINLDF